MLIALLLVNPALSPRMLNGIIVVMMISIIIFSFKYMINFSNDTVVWKSYPRMLISYTTALYLISQKQTNLAGMIVMFDTLMGLQSRHIASTLTCGRQSEKEKS